MKKKQTTTITIIYNKTLRITIREAFSSIIEGEKLFCALRLICYNFILSEKHKSCVSTYKNVQLLNTLIYILSKS